MVLPEWLEKVLTSSVTWLVTAVVLPALISRIPKVRDWFVSQTWRLAAAVGAVTAVITTLAIGNLKPYPEGLPSGLVIASQIACEKLPGKWTLFQEGGGRFIIGAGQHSPNPYVTKLYSAFTTEDDVTPTGFEASTGGEEKHMLTPDELASHNHVNEGFDAILHQGGGYTVKGVDGGDAPEPDLRASGKLLESGKNVPHNNMPPYIALYFCKKD